MPEGNKSRGHLPDLAATFVARGLRVLSGPDARQRGFVLPASESTHRVVHRRVQSGPPTDTPPDIVRSGRVEELAFSPFPRHIHEVMKEKRGAGVWLNVTQFDDLVGYDVTHQVQSVTSLDGTFHANLLTAPTPSGLGGQVQWLDIHNGMAGTLNFLCDTTPFGRVTADSISMRDVAFWKNTGGVIPMYKATRSMEPEEIAAVVAQVAAAQTDEALTRKAARYYKFNTNAQIDLSQPTAGEKHEGGGEPDTISPVPKSGPLIRMARYFAGRGTASSDEIQVLEEEAGLPIEDLTAAREEAEQATPLGKMQADVEIPLTAFAETEAVAAILAEQNADPLTRTPQEEATVPLAAFTDERVNVYLVEHRIKEKLAQYVPLIQAAARRVKNGTFFDGFKNKLEPSESAPQAEQKRGFMKKKAPQTGGNSPEAKWTNTDNGNSRQLNRLNPGISHLDFTFDVDRYDEKTGGNSGYFNITHEEGMNTTISLLWYRDSEELQGLLSAHPTLSRLVSLTEALAPSDKVEHQEMKIMIDEASSEEAPFSVSLSLSQVDKETAAETELANKVENTVVTTNLHDHMAEAQQLAEMRDARHHSHVYLYNPRDNSFHGTAINTDVSATSNITSKVLVEEIVGDLLSLYVKTDTVAPRHELAEPTVVLAPPEEKFFRTVI